MTLTKTLIMVSALVLLLGLVSSTAMAVDVDLGKHTEDEIKSTCDRVGGDFRSDNQIYGCSKACKGGTCAVICTKDDGKCFGTTPDRRQGPAGERGVVDALNATIATTAEPDNRNFFSWGLLGLVGVAGLVGLIRRRA